MALTVFAMTDKADFTADDQRYMELALSLAEKGRCTASPNPCVGAVIVRDGEIVGQGWHKKAGEPHAEILALQTAGELSKGAILYVTLEPCSHTGRTGPCVDALIEAGVASVVFAMSDPNPMVAGAGAARLMAAGIAVKAGLLESAARELNLGFVKRMECSRPFVRLKLAASIDGRSAMASGESQWITGEQARADAQRWRAESCAILTGSGTILQDDPRFSVRESQLGTPVSRQPQLWVCDTHYRLSPALKVFQQAKSLDRAVVLAGDESGSGSVNAAEFSALGVELLSCKLDQGAGIDIAALLGCMANREINCLLVEGGPRISASVLQAGLVDEVLFYIAGKFLGASARPVIDLTFERLAEVIQLVPVDVATMGSDIRVRAKVMPS